MRTFVLLLFATLAAASVVVWRLQPPTAPNGKILLTWVSDPNPARSAQAALFEKLNPNIRVNIDPDNSGVEKVIVQCLGAVGPDVFDSHDAFELAAFAKSGVALDVTDDLRRSGIDLQTQVFPGVLPENVYQGRDYGVPDNIAADGLWYHADVLRKADITLPKPPWRWDQLVPIAQRLTKRGPDGTIERYGLLFEWWNWRHFFTGFGARMFNAQGTRCITDSPNAIAAVQTMYDLVYKYHVTPTPVEETSMAASGGFGSGYITLFAAKRSAMAIGGRWWLQQLRAVPNLELRATESPFGTVHQFHGYGRGLLVNRQSRHLAEALKFQRFMASEPYLDLINDQADGISAFRRGCARPDFLFNAKYPKEIDNAIWLRITADSVGDDISPYVDSSTANRLMLAQLDLVQAGQKTPADGMRDAAGQINAAIAKSVAEDPGLADRYRAALRSDSR